MYIMYVVSFIQISLLVLEVQCFVSYNEEEMDSIAQNLVFLVLRITGLLDKILCTLTYVVKTYGCTLFH